MVWEMLCNNLFPLKGGQTVLFIQNGKIVPALITLARKYGIDVSDDVAPKDLNDKLQQTWFKDGYLRYQIAGDPPSADDQQLLSELGCIASVAPASERYTGVLLLGALRPRVVSRLHFLTCYQYTVEFDMLYLLGGARPLDPVKEGRDVLCTPAELSFREGWAPPQQLPATEAEMMKLVWTQSHLRASWRCTVVDTPLQPKPDGSTRPPNTGDTVREWLRKYDPKPGHYLALSNQPFVQYQEFTVVHALPEGFSVQACGPESSLTLPLATYLDNCAKQLFEETRS